VQPLKRCFADPGFRELVYAKLAPDFRPSGSPSDFDAQDFENFKREVLANQNELRNRLLVQEAIVADLKKKAEELFLFKTREWYAKPADERWRIMQEHIQVGREYPTVDRWKPSRRRSAGTAASVGANHPTRAWLGMGRLELPRSPGAPASG
jgi:hypothetical protein